MNNIIILFVVIWLLFRFMGVGNKKKTGHTASKQQQSVDMQKRLREAYKNAQQQQAEPPQVAREDAPVDDDLPPYHRQSTDEPLLSERPIERHHIDEVEEERCAAATRAKEEQRQQERQLARQQVVPVPGRPMRAQTLTQAERKLYTLPSAPRQKAIPGITDAASPKSPAAADIATMWQDVDLTKNVLVQGIVMAEVLGPPRSKRRLQR